MWPVLRMGRSGCLVDNAGQGGIFAAIDVKTGVTFAAADESRNRYFIHPDSHKELIGFVVPRWEEACALAKSLSYRLPEAGFVGWDLALTDDGWVMVEGNAYPLIIYQIALGKGIRGEFDEMRRKMIHFKNMR